MGTDSLPIFVLSLFQLSRFPLGVLMNFSLQPASPGSFHIKTKALLVFLLVGQGRTECVFCVWPNTFSRKPSFRPSCAAVYCSILNFPFRQTSRCNQSEGRERYKFITAAANTQTLFLTQGRDQFTATVSTSNWGVRLCKSDQGDIELKMKPFSTACSQDWQQAMSLYSSLAAILEIM